MIGPVEVIKKYATETQQALADGYRGPRISADVTDLVGTPELQHIKPAPGGSKLIFDMSAVGFKHLGLAGLEDLR